MPRAWYTLFATNATCQLNVLWHDRQALVLNRAKAAVLKKRHEVNFCGLLERQKRCRLKTEVVAQVLSNLSDLRKKDEEASGG